MAIAAFLDAHHHLWDMRDYHVWIHADPPLETIVGDYEAIRRNYLSADFLADAGAIPLVGSVHVQAEWNPVDPVGETEWLSTESNSTGVPTAIVGYADLSSPDVASVLDRHQRYERFRGVRQMVNWDSRPERSFAPRPHMLLEDEWRSGFRELQRRGLVFDLQLWPRQYGEAIDLLRANPDSAVAINHLGFPIDRDEESMQLWRRGLAELAKFPRVHLKLSGVGLLDHAWSIGSIRELLLTGIEIFGPDRCMFGSNFPVDKLFADYASLLAAYDSVVSDFTSEDRDRLFWETAARFYDIEASLFEHSGSAEPQRES